MDSQPAYFLTLLVLLSLLSLRSTVIEGKESVYFLDSSSHRYFRPRTAEVGSVSLPEVGAAASVLLGFAPPATLSAASSLKLNELLMPNPFDRPRALFMLEVTGTEDSQLGISSDEDLRDSALRSDIIGDGKRADILLPDGQKVLVLSSNEYPNDAQFTDKEVNDLILSLGGSYINDATEQLSGELKIPLGTDDHLSLHLSKVADRKFITSLISLTRLVKRAIETHEDVSQTNPSQLITGKFDGIEALIQHYGAGNIAQQGLKVFLASVSKIFDSLNAAYKGHIAGVILYSSSPSESETIFNVAFTSQSSARWLEESKESTIPIAIVEAAFVRRTVAWITGIVLIIATLMGVHFLLNMPLTKDTLLYSNVKLD